MEPKPSHLGPSYASQFQEPGVAEAYVHRPPYPAETFDVLESLCVGPTRRILDLGAGTGDLARPLALRSFTVDAVDVSEPMIARGRALPGGDTPSLRWRIARAEDVPPEPPYALVTAGQSWPWFAWDVVAARCAATLEPGGVVALVERSFRPVPWDPALGALIRAYSTNRDFRSYDLSAELLRRGVFEVLGQRETPHRPFDPSIEEFLELLHSQNGLTRHRMGATAASFDAEVRALLRLHGGEGDVRRLTGRPARLGRSKHTSTSVGADPRAVRSRRYRRRAA